LCNGNTVEEVRARNGSIVHGGLIIGDVLKIMIYRRNCYEGHGEVESKMREHVITTKNECGLAVVTGI